MGSTSTAPGSGPVSTWTGGLIVAGGAIAVLSTGKLLQCVLYRTGQTSTAGGVGVVPFARFFFFFPFQFCGFQRFGEFFQNFSNCFLIYTLKTKISKIF
jgi:hypothetical protein